jgi:diadenosine tetraphosphate (Ap4A) HIT family hydrolase
MAAFTLHPRLAADTHFLADMPLCRVLLLNDARFPWLILVPRRTALRELTDLHIEDRSLAFDEIERASDALRKLYAPTRINVAAIGNIVNQLHIHVVARSAQDAAWPGTVWGHGTTEPYDAPALAQRRSEILPFFGTAR